MPLTPTDVANKQFRIAFRGYSLDEVDAFLDEVETELSRLLRENAAATRGSDPSPTAAPTPASASTPTSTPTATPPAPPALASPLTGMEGQETALRTLLLAQRTADEAIAEARAEAEQILATAREEADSTLTSARAEAEQALTSARAEAEQALTSARTEAEQTLTSARAEAEQTLTSARTEAEQTLSAAQSKAARVDQDVAARIQAATGDLDTRRRELERRIEELRAFEREYRTRLQAYLEAQLRDLSSGEAPDDSGAGVPQGARSTAVTGPHGARGADSRAGAPARGPAAAPSPAPVPAVAPPAAAAGAPAVAPGAPPAVAPAGAPDRGENDQDAQGVPDGPPREAGAPSALRAVPPLRSGGPAVGPFTVVRPTGAEADTEAGTDGETDDDADRDAGSAGDDADR